MSRGSSLPDELARDIARVVGADVTVLGDLPGGVNTGAKRVELSRGGSAVLKTSPRTRDEDLSGILLARRVVEHMRARGYPTPAWLGAGATAAQVWHLTELVDAAPVTELTPAVVGQLMEIAELQADQASEPHDHSTYAWRVATGSEPVADRVSRHSPAVSGLVERARVMTEGAEGPPPAQDMVHADLNPSNVLVRDGAVVAIVDIANAGRGTRATDLTTLKWHAFDDRLDGVRGLLRARILDLVGWDGAAVLESTQILLQLEWRIGLGREDAVLDVVQRGHRALDELDALHSG